MVGAVRFALVAGLVLASSTSVASPLAKGGEPRLRDRAIVSGSPARARSAFAPLAARGWRASWDRDTGVPARIWGSYVDVPDAVGDAAVAERAARRFLAEHAALLAPGASASDFVVVANQLDDGIRSVGFAQTYRGVPVLGGGVGFVFAHDRLFAISSSAWPDVTVALPRPMRAILPIVAGARGAVQGARVAYHGVDIVEDGLARSYRDSHGRELRRESRIMHATGTLAYHVGVRHAGGVRADAVVPAASITVNGSAVTTAPNGTFSWPGMAAATVVPSVTGTYVRIVNQAGPLATTTLTAQPDESVVWDLASDEYGDAQLSTYVYANQAKAKARIVNPSVAAWLDTPLDFYVNENGTCNAYSTGDEVHLYRAGTGCANTGRLADVVFHEFGHSLHAHSVIAGMGAFEPHLSEGLSDFFAANLTGDPAMGRGFYLDESPLRDVDPVGSERVYPLDFDFDPHISGLIIAGALWDLRKALIRQLGPAAGVARAEKIYTGIMQRADDIGTTFAAALIADDDDGNLGNNTPNYCAIERAFGQHGLVPDFASTRVHPPIVDDRDISVAVDMPAAPMCTPPTVVAIKVTWRANDGVASSFDLVPQGAVWTGAFPAQPDGTLIEYAVDVVFDDGSLQAFPNNPADPRYQVFLGNATPIYCESFDVDPEWEQSSNRGFEWQWGPPVIGRTGHDPDAAFTGDNVLGTDLTSDGQYRSDLVVSVMTPVVDVSAYQRVRLQYRRWLTVEDAVFDQATIRANNHEIWRNAQSAATGTLDHVDREWRYHDLDLTPYVEDGALQIAWALTTDYGKELGGWTLDDVCIVGLQKNAVCGDGALDPGEACDDGNTDSGDGCDRTCDEELVAGGGGCCDAGGGGPGSLLLALLVLVTAAGRGAARAPGRCGRSRCACRSKTADRAGRPRSSA